MSDCESESMSINVMMNRQNAQPSTNQTFVPKLLVLALLGDAEPAMQFNPQM
jgi:hypothetical protein